MCLLQVGRDLYQPPTRQITSHSKRAFLELWDLPVLANWRRLHLDAHVLVGVVLERHHWLLDRGIESHEAAGSTDILLPLFLFGRSARVSGAYPRVFHHGTQLVHLS